MYQGNVQPGTEHRADAQAGLQAQGGEVNPECRLRGSKVIIESQL